MLIIVSPAKKLDYDTTVAQQESSQPRFISQSAELVDVLKQMAPHDLSSLMHISDDLGKLNYDRYQAWQPEFTDANAKPAVYAFKGDVYVGLEAERFDEQARAYAQQHLRILSGLYGVLRPHDLMQAYRLEMGTKLANNRGKDLYAFWGETITQSLNDDLAAVAGKTIVNLASNEYFKSVKKKQLAGELITPHFKELKNGAYKVISFYAKKARGQMAAYAINNQLQQAEQLKQFNQDGYSYNAELSSASDWVFTRDQA